MAKTLTAGQSTAAAAAASAPQAAPVSFMEATEETTEHWGQKTVQMLATGPVQVNDIKVPTFGFFRSLLLKITVHGAADAGAIAMHADAPWNIIQNFTVGEPNGRTTVGPISGYNLYLGNKWCPTTAWMADPANSPVFSGADADGNFTIVIRIPGELGGRDPLGVLSNQQNDSRFKVAFAIAGASTVYTDAPGTLPEVDIEWLYEAYAPVTEATPEGTGVQAIPQHHGTFQRLVVTTPEVAAGNKRVPFTEVGNLIRFLVMVVRDNTGARSDAKFPDYYRFSRDTNPKDIAPAWAIKHYMWERSGQDPDTGVYVIFDGEHDLDGRSGQGMRYQWMKTSSSTRLELEGEWKAGIGSTVEIITNDVVTTAGAVQG